MRLNRYLAACGLGSRRACEALISDGRVSINGHFVRELATTVQEGDEVRVAGKRLNPPRRATVLALYKPRGVLSTRSDERSRPTIYDYVPRHMTRLFHVGRLDKESEGLMVLTDDGELGHAMTHPSRKVEKEYEVTLDKAFDPEHAEKLLRGFMIEGGRAKMEKIRAVGAATVRIVLGQGIKRQIRLMLHRMGYDVKRLIRIRIGTLDVGNMRPGEWRPLNEAEIAMLRGKAKVAR